MCSVRTTPKQTCPVSYYIINNIGQVSSHVPGSFPRTNLNVNLHVCLINTVDVCFVEAEVINDKKKKKKEYFVSCFLHLDEMFP